MVFCYTTLNANFGVKQYLKIYHKEVVMLKVLEAPDGQPVGKPFVLSLVLTHEQFKNGELMSTAAKEAESRITNDSVSANAVVLGHYFPQV